MCMQEKKKRKKVINNSRKQLFPPKKVKMSQWSKQLMSGFPKSFLLKSKCLICEHSLKSPPEKVIETSHYWGRSVLHSKTLEAHTTQNGPDPMQRTFSCQWMNVQPYPSQTLHQQHSPLGIKLKVIRLISLPSSILPVPKITTSS